MERRGAPALRSGDRVMFCDTEWTADYVMVRVCQECLAGHQPIETRAPMART